MKILITLFEIFIYGIGALSAIYFIGGFILLCFIREFPERTPYKISWKNAIIETIEAIFTITAPFVIWLWILPKM